VRSDQTPERAETSALLTISLIPTVEDTMRVGLYARVSTKDQSCELQLRDLRTYCEARGFIIFREYIDQGVSGSKNSRPELDKLMGDARKRKIEAVICWRFDRFARSCKHLLLALEEFRELGVGFVSYMENIDTTSALGRAIFTIVAAVAELEKNLIVERVQAGINHARACGKQLGRPRQRVDVERLAELQASGISLRQIASELGCGYGTVRERLQSSERKTPGRIAEEICPITGIPLSDEAGEKLLFSARQAPMNRGTVAGKFVGGE
jgi:DNA invertase Pin-like site-specific DNA recombinase